MNGWLTSLSRVRHVYGPMCCVDTHGNVIFVGISDWGGEDWGVVVVSSHPDWGCA